MVHDTLITIGIISVVLAVGFFITSLAMFIGYRIPALWKDSKGTLEQKQIDEIRAMRSTNANRRGKLNVFEELEKQAKPRKTGAQSIKFNTNSQSQTGNQPHDVVNSSGTVVLKKTSKAINPNFIIEKDITFVSTSEVI